MKLWIAALLLTFAVGAYAQCPPCESLKWATCDGTPCQCTIMVGNDEKQPLTCAKLIPKCFLMKAEMYRARKGLSTRTGGKPVESAFVDNDGIYDPECENDGKFKAKQCNGTEECWCVNSAGVRRSDKSDKDIKCDKLVETYWIRLELKHKEVTTKVDKDQLKSAIGTAIENRYKFDKNLVDKIEYDPEARLIVVDVKKAIGERGTDMSGLAYYMEKDVKVLPLFKDQAKFEPVVNGQKLEMENILVYYVDEERPTFTMKRLTAGIIAVIVVVILAVIAGLLVLFFARRREQQKYSKAQPREMEAM
ncbi:epithelial cell adhesion molecule [Hypomesus transpacificus]|uniref:epithelial cell adhesion molecule n=1 Tax=Hypomesus transpacificus TaxID=137520 RepID=UPI001F085A1F|nr:epithelial cell adhesion molecule [Hypomesus transpacificus]